MSTAKQQSPHENNQTAFNLVMKGHYEQANPPCKVELGKGIQDGHIFNCQVPHLDLSQGQWPRD